jgi:hypothetical protein
MVFLLEYDGSTFLHNFGKFGPKYKVLHHRREIKSSPMFGLTLRSMWALHNELLVCFLSISCCLTVLQLQKVVAKGKLVRICTLDSVRRRFEINRYRSQQIRRNIS